MLCHVRMNYIASLIKDKIPVRKYVCALTGNEEHFVIIRFLSHSAGEGLLPMHLCTSLHITIIINDSLKKIPVLCMSWLCAFNFLHLICASINYGFINLFTEVSLTNIQVLLFGATCRDTFQEFLGNVFASTATKGYALTSEPEQRTCFHSFPESRAATSFERKSCTRIEWADSDMSE